MVKKSRKAKKSKDEAKAPELEEEAPSIRVTDKRFWVRDDWDPEDKSESRMPTVVEKLRDKVKDNEKEVRDIRSAARQFREESEQFRRRIENDVNKKVRNSQADFLAEMVEVMDNLERSIDAAGDFDEANEKEAIINKMSSLIEGVKMVHLQFMEKLGRYDVKKIEVLGKEFDPQTSEALDVQETDDENEHNKVVKVFQEAYAMGERTIRPARVCVAKFKEDS